MTLDIFARGALRQKIGVNVPECLERLETAFRLGLQEGRVRRLLEIARDCRCLFVGAHGLGFP